METTTLMATKPFAIYSAVVGNYDEIKQPCVVDERFDYILFSNEIQETNIGVWQIHSIPYVNQDKTRICRYVKTHPQKLLPGYVASVWMDSNIQIRTSNVYTRIFELLKSGTVVSTMSHPLRDCIYKEAYVIITYLMDNERDVINWGHILRSYHYPRNKGLCETNVLFRRHNEIMANMDDIWWNYIKLYSKRDQLSFNFVLWQLHIKNEFFLPYGMCTRNSQDFVYYTHAKERESNMGGDKTHLLEYFLETKDTHVENMYYFAYMMPNPYLCCNLLGYLVRSHMYKAYRSVRRFIKNTVMSYGLH